MASSEFRAARVGDALGIARVHVRSWQETYGGILPEEILERLDVDSRLGVWSRILETPPPPWVFVYLNGGVIQGFASASPLQDERCRLDALYLLKAHQGRRIGARLFRLIQHCVSQNGFNEMCLWVQKDNPAVGFYEHVGGINVGEATIEHDGHGIPCCEFHWRGLSSLTG